MTNPVILYNSLIPSATTITVTSEAAGFAKENAYDWLTFDYWKPSAAGTVYYTMDFGAAVAVDGWGVAAHDLGVNGASIQLQYSATGAWAGEEVNFGSAISPAASEPRLQTGTSQSKRYWRFKIVSAAAASKIGVLMLGARLTMNAPLESGFKPDALAQRYEPTINQSDEATILGASRRRKLVENSLTFDLLEPSWVRTNWDPFIRHVELGKGFMIQPQPDNYPDEVTYAFAKDNIKTPSHSFVTLMQVSIDYYGIAA